MYPHERSLVKQLADKPFALIGVNSDSDLDEIREVVKEKNLTWRSFQNEQEESSISDDWGIQGWPTIFVLDEHGKIRYTNVRGDRMDRAIETLLAEMGEDVEIKHEDEEEEEEEEEEAPKKKRRKKNKDSDDSSEPITEAAEEATDGKKDAAEDDK